jgi:patatin-like phospholipase/acyl hydrolase
MANSDLKTIKVLSIDGGGIRGIIPAVILGEMQKRLGKDLYNFFDLTTTSEFCTLLISTRGDAHAQTGRGRQ